MSKNRYVNKREHAVAVTEAIFLVEGDRAGVEDSRNRPVRSAALPVQSIERTAIVRFEDAEMLFEGSAVQAVDSSSTA